MWSVPLQFHSLRALVSAAKLQQTTCFYLTAIPSVCGDLSRKIDPLLFVGRHTVAPNGRLPSGFFETSSQETMSGIVGIVNLDRKPLDQDLLAQLVNHLTFRGPDRTGIWVEGAAGLGHTLLATTDEAVGEEQPRTLNDEAWITADARVDGRGELIAKLSRNGLDVTKGTTDPELILYAYQLWGEDCVDHLLGDFAFAIWDGREQKLFAARDHFGVKPFYYARIGDTIVFSNTLSCVRLHPLVSSQLVDSGLTDSLIFGYTIEPDRTIFEDVLILPAAHRLRFTLETTSIYRYWRLPTPELLRYKSTQDYVDQFNSLLDTAVLDRLRQPAVTLELSGGMDSTSLAAAVRRVKPDSHLYAFTVVYESLPEDHEGIYSAIAANYLGVDHTVVSLDRFTYFDGWESDIYNTPTPSNNPWRARHRFIQSDIVKTRVVLNGDGADSALYPSHGYLIPRLLHGHFADVARGALQYFRLTGRLPNPYLRTFARRLISSSGHPRTVLPKLPAWMPSELLDESKVVERLAERDAAWRDQSHPLRPIAYRDINHPSRARYLEQLNLDQASVLRETRFPFFDIRLVSYLLSLPPVPWFENKLLLRQAMEGWLPEAILKRPKAPFYATPLHYVSEAFAQSDPAQLATVDGTEKYVNWDEALRGLKQVSEALPREIAVEIITPFSLAHWMLTN